MTITSLASACSAHHVPGAVVGVLRDGTVHTVAHGVANRRTGQPVSANTVFQVGSITKVFTTTLVMSLVDDGLVDLDEPIRTYLPAFAVAGRRTSEQLTLRHLLSHTSGIAGDHFADTGRGDDALERYVATCADLPQEQPLGEWMSYCNAGFSIVGAVVEAVTGLTWDRALRTRVIKPLGLTSAGTLPEQALLHHAAVGHLGLPGSEPEPTPLWSLFSRSAGPAGNVHSSAADLLAFARFHLDGGVAADGTRLLSAASIAAMQEPHVEVADRWSLGTHWGLGWTLYRDAGPGWGHDGNTVTQFAFLRVFPDHGVAACLLTNGGDAGRVWRAVLAELAEQTGIEIAPAPEPPAAPPSLDLARYVGRYERLHVRADVEQAPSDNGATNTGAGAGGLVAVIERTGPLGAALPADARVQRCTLTPVDRSLFLAQVPGAPAPSPLVFCDFDGDTPGRFQHGLRLHTRP